MPIIELNNASDINIHNAPWSVPEEFFELTQTGDMLLVCEGGRAVRCHSQILAMTCLVLRNMLQDTGAAEGHSTEQPATLFMAGDDAFHWLYALQYLYPPLAQPPIPNHGNAEAVGQLGHKYDVPLLQKVWKEFSAGCCRGELDVGHHKWVVRNWQTQSQLEGGIRSPPFHAAGHDWELHLYPKGNSSGTHVGLFLHGKGKHTEHMPLAEFTFKVVHQVPPFQDFVSKTFEIQFCKDCPTWGWAELMPLSYVNDASKGFIRGDTLALQVNVQVFPKPGATCTCSAAKRSQHWQLSDDPSDAKYVCKWLQVACSLKDEQLKAACVAFLARSAFHVHSTNAQLQKDVCAAMSGVEMTDLLQLLS